MYFNPFGCVVSKNTFFCPPILFTIVTQKEECHVTKKVLGMNTEQKCSVGMNEGDKKIEPIKRYRWIV